MATDNRRIAKNTIFLYFRMMVVMAVSLVTAGVTMRVLGSVNYGLYAVLGGIVAMFSFLNAALGSAVSRNITFEIGRGDEGRLRDVFNASLVVFVLLALLVVVLSETIGLWFFFNKMVIPEERLGAAFWVYQISVVSVLFTVTQIPYSSVLIAHENMKIYAYVSMADAVARLLIVYLLYVSPFDKLVTLASLHFAWSVCTISFYRLYCMRKYPETHLSMCRDRHLYKGILAYAGADLIGNLSCLAQGQGLNLLLNTFFGPVVNAARGVAYGLQGMTTQFSGGFMTAVVPQIIKAYAQSDFDGMWRLVKRSSCYSLYLIWLLALPAWLEGDFVLSLWLGEYPAHTLSFFHLIVVVCLIDISRRAIINVIHATGHVFLENVAVGSVLCLSFPVAYALLRMGYPPEAVFWCTIGAQIAGGVLEMFVLRRYHRYDIVSYFVGVYGRGTLVILVSSIVPCALYSRYMQPCVVRMILTGVLTTLSVSLSALWLGMGASDRRHLFDIIRRKMNWRWGAS